MTKIHVFKKSEYFKDELPVVIQHHTHSAKDFCHLDGGNRRQFWKIFYVVSGKGLFKLNGKTYPLYAGFICLNHPDDLTNAALEEDIEVYNILFLKESIDNDLRKLYSAYNFFRIFNFEFLPENTGDHGFLHLLDANRTAYSLIRRMYHEYTHCDANTREMLRYMLLELLVELSRLSSRRFPGKRCDEIISFIETYLHENYRRPLDVRKLAAEAGISREYLIRSFRAATGSSIGQSMLEIRLAKASDLLRTTELSVTEICFECGFSDLSNFYKFFRRKFKCAPGEFRNAGF